MAKKYNPNQDLIEAANTAAACGMSYGEWMAKGCPVPSKKQKREAEEKKSGCRTQHRYGGGPSTGRKI